jgi:hypothetical protein
LAKSWWLSDDQEAVRYARLPHITTYKTFDLSWYGVGWAQ